MMNVLINMENNMKVKFKINFKVVAKIIKIIKIGFLGKKRAVTYYNFG
jgi:hypothetical protein